MLGKTKKIIKCILSIILILFIIGWPIYNIVLNNIEINQEDISKGNEWKGIITIWDFPRLNVETGSRYGWITKKIKKFEKDNPGVYIRLEPINWNTGPFKLETGLRTGNLPDIAPITNDFIYLKDNVLEPLDSYFSENEKQRFKYQAIKAVTYDRTMWAVPCMMTTYAMFLNLDLFKERDVEPPLDGNWTYEEFVEKMQKLTYDSDNDGKTDKYGFVSFVKPNYYNLWGIILSDGGELINKNGDYSFFGQKANKGLNKAVDLKHKYKVTPENFGILNENEAWELFYKEKKVAVYPTGTWAVRVLENLNRKGEGFDFTVANYPIGDRKLPVSLNNSVVSYGVFKQENKEKLDMCVKFLKFLVQDNYQKDLDDLGMFPAKSGIRGIYENNPKMKRLEDCLAYTQILPLHREWKDIDRILQSQIRMAVIGEKSGEDALDEARKQINQLLK